MRNPLVLALGIALAVAQTTSATEVDVAADDAKSRANASAAANRIVGLWKVDVSIGPCGGAPNAFFSAFNTFHQGGTLSDTNFAAPASRGPGQGIWAYVAPREYDVRTQFMRFLPTGAPDGIQDIYNAVVLDARGNRYTSAVRARALNLDGSIRVELCGTAQGTRVRLE